MNVTIWGGAGFLGSHLVDRYLADGHHVTVVDDLRTGALTNLAHVLNQPDFRFEPADPARTALSASRADLRIEVAPDASAVKIHAGPLDTRVARVFETYGPRMRPSDGGLIPLLIRETLAGEALSIRVDGEQARGFLYVDDAVEGIVRLAASPDACGASVDLAHPERMPLREVGELIARLAGVQLRFTQQNLQWREAVRALPDVTIARESLGWEPRTGLREGIVRTFDWLAAAGRAVS